MPLRLALLCALALVACRPRQAAPAESRLLTGCSPCSYTDEEGTFHIVDTPDQIPPQYRPRPPRDARLWSAGDEDPRPVRR